MFDHAEIVVKGGQGGNGAITFRREKFVPYGGPDGGNGGDGGSVILEAEASITDLRDYQPRSAHRAGRGGSGQGRKKHGVKGDDLVLKVPPGTVVYAVSESGKCLVQDLETPGQRFIAARGGRGGRGNCCFATPTRQAPEIAEKGEDGQEERLVLEMRLIADAGIIGQPNVGKSSLLAAASAAKPRVAGYPFTTIEPVLGVVYVGEDSFVLAEIPGLIEDAHLGRGLGYEFLRHAMRTRLLINLVDGTSASPVEDMIAINRELSEFDVTLGNKPRVVAVNKIDLPEVKSRRAAIEAEFKSVATPVRFISAATGEGVQDLMAEVLDKIHEVIGEESKPEDEKVFRPGPRSPSVTVRQENGVFVLEAFALERLVGKGGEITPELELHIKRQLDRQGARRALLRAGIKPGDRVRFGAMEWAWWE